MSPGSDALASKLCKCILPVKLKPSLLVLRGLVHRVLHHSLGSGPLHFPIVIRPRINSVSSPPAQSSHFLACLSPACLFLRAPGGTADGRLQLQSEPNEDIQLGATQNKKFVAAEPFYRVPQGLLYSPRWGSRQRHCNHFEYQFSLEPVL